MFKTTALAGRSRVTAKRWNLTSISPLGVTTLKPVTKWEVFKDSCSCTLHTLYLTKETIKRFMQL